MDSKVDAERPEKTRCPTCGRLFKCVDAHHLVKHGSFVPRSPQDCAKEADRG